MQVVFVRHGERRKGEVDPELTSAGRRMAAETGAWLAARGFAPNLMLCTPTARTRQTAEELASMLPPTPLEFHNELPEARDDWEALMAAMDRRLGSAASLLLVGHHPTLHFLADTFGPLPAVVPRHNFAAALVLERALQVWSCKAVWPGRAG